VLLLLLLIAVLGMHPGATKWMKEGTEGKSNWKEVLAALQTQRRRSKVGSAEMASVKRVCLLGISSTFRYCRKKIHFALNGMDQSTLPFAALV
jgi:hypothetical protein